MKQLFLIFSLVGLIACETSGAKKTIKPEYNTHNDGIKFKYIQFGDGKSPKAGDYVRMNIVITDTLSDTLHYVGDYPYFFKLKDDELSVALTERNLGDSGVYQMERDVLDRFYTFDHGLQTSNSKLKVFFRLMDIVDNKQINAVHEEVLFHRKLKEQKLLHKYLQEQKLKVDSINGIYRIVEKHNPNGTIIQKGSKVTIDYVGKYIDGYEFENTLKKEISPVFQYGKDFQLIEGMQIGLKGLKSGEKVKIILSSRHAFGKEGSLAGIVPPNTAVIFEVNIKNVTH